MYAKQKHQVRQTKHQVRQTKHKVRQPKYQVRQTKQQVRNFNQKSTPKNKCWFTLFCRDAIFVANIRTFLTYNLQAEKCGGVQKRTNMRYAHKAWTNKTLLILVYRVVQTLDNRILNNTNSGQCNARVPMPSSPNQSLLQFYTFCQHCRFQWCWDLKGRVSWFFYSSIGPVGHNM